MHTVSVTDTLTFKRADKSWKKKLSWHLGQQFFNHLFHSVSASSNIQFIFVLFNNVACYAGKTCYFESTVASCLHFIHTFLPESMFYCDNPAFVFINREDWESMHSGSSVSCHP